MSRSRKKTPFYSANAGAMKWWKRSVNKTHRQQIRQSLKRITDWDELIVPIMKEAGSWYDSPKDGHGGYFNPEKGNQCQHDLNISRSQYWKFDENGHHQFCDCCGVDPNSWFRKLFRK